MAAGIESLVAKFALHAMKKCAAFSAHIIPVLLPFWRHVEVLASENTENGSRETMRTGKGKQCGKATLSGPASQGYGEQIPNGMSRQTITDSTGDTELTIDVGNLVAKIRKSKVIELF
jgi:hypothetical protein